MINRRRVLQIGSATMLASCSGGEQLGKANMKTPKANHGFHLPEESLPHTLTFMQWPSEAKVYGRRGLGQVQEDIFRIANAIAEYEPVILLSADEQTNLFIDDLHENVTHWDIPTNDLWARDAGPCFVKNAAGDLAVMDFNFNGWGENQVHYHDMHIARLVAKRLGLPRIDSGVCGEPGGLDQDGDGTIIAHESSWINPNRNPGKKAEITKLILAATGARKLIWAPGLMGQDITDYHIDSLARFVEPGHIVIQLPDKITPGDPFSKAAYETLDVLKSAKDANGRKFEFTILRDPVNIRSRAKDMVISYINYYVCNGAVINAQYGDDKADGKAQDQLKALYPSRDIVMLDVDEVAKAGGGVHCATQQHPA